MREGEKKKKYYRNGQSHHLSHVCMCRLTCESIPFCERTHRQIEPINSRRKCYRNERECAIKKNAIETVSFLRFSLSLSLSRSPLLDEQTLSKYFEYSCKDFSLSFARSFFRS